MCGDHHSRDSLGGALAVLNPCPLHTGASSMRMTGRLVFQNREKENPMATHAIFMADLSHVSSYTNTVESCLVRIHETGDLTKPVIASPSWAAFSLRTAVRTPGDDETRWAEVELERPLKMEVGVDGIIGRRVSIWTERGAGPVAEGIVGYN